MTDYTKDDSIDPERMGQWTMASKLLYTYFDGATADDWEESLLTLRRIARETLAAIKTREVE